MPPNLRLCFAYCAIFPKGHIIVKDQIIHQWNALGFIEQSDIFSTRQLGEAYVRQLLGLCFLQQTKAPSTTRVHNEDSTFLTMHDLVHDFARSILFDAVLDSGKKINIGVSSCRYGMLRDCSKPLELVTPSPAKIRALHFLGCGKIELHGVAFSSASCLRVLDLSGCSILRLPASIGQLKQLRYLNAPGMKNRMIPKCITKLSKLNFLSLCRSRAISALPESIGEIEGLMHLDLSGCSRLKELPKSFGKLRRLVHLNLSNCSRVKDVSEYICGLTNLEYLNLSVCRKIGFLPRTLGSLTELKYLNLSGCFGIKELPKSFQQLKNLVHLDLSCCNCVKDLSEALDGLAKLQYLNLSYCHHYGNQFRLRGLPEVIGNLTSLRHLHLSGFLDNIFGNQSGVMDKLLEIGYLNLSTFQGNIFQQLPPGQSHSFIECIGALSNLEHLNLSNNVSLYSVPESLGNLRKLHTLDLTGCIGLLWLPESISKIQSLKYVLMKDLLRLKSTLSCFNNGPILLPNFVVQAVDKKSSNLGQLLDANPAELDISSLENVKSTKEAKGIKLSGKRNIVKLKFDWTIGTKRYVEDMEVLRELVPPSTVKYFELRGYHSTSFPTWLMGIAHCLPNLVKIKIVDLSKCSILPLGQLPNLKQLVLGRMKSITKIDADFCGGARAFPQLKTFDIYSMERLQEWNTTYSCGEDGVTEFMFPNLQWLSISDCPNLVVKPLPPRVTWWKIEGGESVISSWGGSVHTGTSSSSCSVTNLVVKFCTLPLSQWSLLHHLPALRHLTIHWCADLTSSPEIIQDLHSLKSLSLDGNEQAELPDWLGDLPSLQELKITMYPALTELQEKIRQLMSLQSLTLSSCQMLTSLGEWFGSLTSLQELHISHCQRLNSFPEGMQYLTSLLSLHLSYCESISALPEWLGNLTSLKTLQIWECRGIKSLPESIEQLTMLEHLEISGCPELKQWCELEDSKTKLAHIKNKCFW
ncbi:hypothetical protein DAI22_11g073100 [Oryza sativa Japonica Group]|jgi:Leucine-rich repeat (LRR) protein|nr:hypothetical protein DAI22_11g073100 [Oryza sativa Japonica Group]